MKLKVFPKELPSILTVKEVAVWAWILTPAAALTVPVVTSIFPTTDSEAFGNLSAEKKGQVGSGMRGDKKRTYRFQDDRVLDHVTNKRAKCSRVMRGHFELLW